MTEKERRQDAEKRLKRRVLTPRDLLGEYDEAYELCRWMGMTQLAAHLCALAQVNDSTDRKDQEGPRY